MLVQLLVKSYGFLLRKLAIRASGMKEQSVRGQVGQRKPELPGQHVGSTVCHDLRGGRAADADLVSMHVPELGGEVFERRQVTRIAWRVWKVVPGPAGPAEIRVDLGGRADELFTSRGETREGDRAMCPIVEGGSYGNDFWRVMSCFRCLSSSG